MSETNGPAPADLAALGGPWPGGGIDDSHAHLDMADFGPDRDAVVARARAAGVRRILCPADLSEPASLDTVLGLAARDPGIFAAAGVHPHNARKLEDSHLQTLRRLAAEGAIRAVGEIGLDFHYNFSSPEEQRGAFRRQLELAAELKLPAIVHSREAVSEVLTAVGEAKLSAGGVLHCYTEDAESALYLVDRGFFVSFSGILTFSGAEAVRETARAIPRDRLLVETDSPYLAPVPLRGRRSEPAFVVVTARVLAVARGDDPAELGHALRRNFERCFRVEQARG